LPRSRLPSFGGQVARDDRKLKWLDIACPEGYTSWHVFKAAAPVAKERPAKRRKF